MLWTNRRARMIFIFLAGMESAFLAPYALVLLRRSLPDGEGLAALSPWALFAALWATALLYMAVADLLNRRQIESPWHDLILVALVLVTTLLGVRLLLYPGAPVGDFGWLAGLRAALFDFTRGLRGELTVALLNVLIWLRVSASSGRDLTFFNVGVSFRLGVLIALAGNALLTTWGGRPNWMGIALFGLFLSCGLAAVALARVDEQARLAEHSTGRVLPWSRLALLLGSVAVTLAAAALVALPFTPGAIRGFFRATSIVWETLGAVTLRLLYALLVFIGPALDRFAAWLRARMGPLEPVTPETPAPFGADAFEPVSMVDILRQWAWVRYCLSIGIILFVLGLIWLLFVRTRQRLLAEEAEESAPAEVEWGGGLLRRGVGRLRRLAGLVRRYGLGPRLLAAVSVEAIYANVSRLARRRGYGREPAQPPDAYLPALIAAFPDCAAELERITEMYMRVEYGDQPADSDELAALRADYAAVRASPPPALDESAPRTTA